MEDLTRISSEPIKEFYYVYDKDGKCNLVSAIGLQGGYIYFLIEASTDSSKRVSGPKISPIENIIDLCGSPKARVEAIAEDDPKTKDLYKFLSRCIDNYVMQSSERVFQ